MKDHHPDILSNDPFTEKEVTKILDCSLPTLYKWVKRGLPYSMHGRRRRYHPVQCVGWLMKNVKMWGKYGLVTYTEIWEQSNVSRRMVTRVMDKNHKSDFPYHSFKLVRAAAKELGLDVSWMRYVADEERDDYLAPYKEDGRPIFNKNNPAFMFWSERYLAVNMPIILSIAGYEENNYKQVYKKMRQIDDIFEAGTKADTISLNYRMIWLMVKQILVAKYDKGGK